MLLFIGLSPGFLFTLPLGSRLHVAIAHGILFATLIGFLSFYLYEGFQSTPVSQSSTTKQGLMPSMQTIETIPTDTLLNICIKNFSCDSHIPEEECKLMASHICRARAKNPSAHQYEVLEIAGSTMAGSMKQAP